MYHVNIINYPNKKKTVDIFETKSGILPNPSVADEKKLPRKPNFLFLSIKNNNTES